MQSWTLPRKILFRFISLYFTLYILSFPAGMMSLPGFAELLKLLASVTGKVMFGAGYTNNIHPTGSGDTQYAYVCIVTILALAFAGTIAWSLLDRRRISYLKLQYWFRATIRYWLAIELISYGMYKVIQIQFLPPTLYDLDQPLGNSTPMGLAWKFFGHSATYNLFMGLAEVIPGILLLFRRTTLAGALLAIGVMTNVFVLNLTYDIPVKQFSGHLLLTAIVIAAPELRRLGQFLSGSHIVQPSTLYKPVFSKRWQRYLVIGIKVIFLFMVLDTYMIERYIVGKKSQAHYAEKQTLYGIYEVKQIKAPVDYNNLNGWQKIYFDQRNMCVIVHNDNTLSFGTFKVDTTKKKVSFTGRNILQQEFSYTSMTDGQLQLTATINNSPDSILLQAKDIPDFRLKHTKFNWVTEYPNNL